MNNTPTPYDDVIDSRDVIAAIEEMEAMQEDGEDIDRDDLHDLKELAAEAEGMVVDWQYGVALVRDSYFTEYAEQLAEDIGAIDRNADWPLSYIDWDAAAEALKMDYVSVEYSGVTYWAR